MKKYFAPQIKSLEIEDEEFIATSLNDVEKGKVNNKYTEEDDLVKQVNFYEERTDW